MQTVAFPQEGIMKDPGADKLMWQAMEMGCDVVGGMPANENCPDDSRAHVKLCFDIAEKYDADVTAVQFLGSSYQLQLNHNGQDWTYISPRRVSVGEKISLYLPRSAIVAV